MDNALEQVIDIDIILVKRTFLSIRTLLEMEYWVAGTPYQKFL